jgi:lipopolysaccharide export system permease protein
MRILNKYVLRNTIIGYFFILAIFVGLYFVIDIFSSLSDMLKAKSPIHTLVAYYFFMLPLIFLRVGPFSLLISALYSFGEMNKTNEITTMRATGISMLNICAPIIVLSITLCALTFFVQEKLLLESQKRVEAIKLRFIKQENTSGDLTNFAFPYGNSIFFAQKFSPKNGAMENVTIFEEDGKGEITSKIICSNLFYQPGNWRGRDVMEYNLDPQGNIFGKPISAVEKDIKLSGLPQEIVSRKTIFTQYASIQDLKKERKRFRKTGAESIYADKTINYHQHIVEPFAHFFMLFAAMPFAAQIKKRRASLSSLATGFIFGFCYYWLSGLSVACAKSGLLVPFIGPWIAPLFFVVVGIVGFLSLR